jgi:hypothetical protein
VLGGVFGVVFGKHPPQNFPFIQRASGHIGGSVGDFLVKLFPDNQNQHLVRLLMKNQSEVPLTSYIHVLGAKISENSRIPKFHQHSLQQKRNSYDSVFTPSNECWANNQSKGIQFLLHHFLQLF